MVTKSMPESRDRLSRPVDLAAIFVRRRAGIISVLDEEAEMGLFGANPRRESTVSIVTPGSTRGGSAVRAGSGAARNAFGRGRGRSWNLFRTPAAGVENTPLGNGRRGRGRTSHSVLPSWYPRTPLRDITAIVRAIERRRTRMGETEGQVIGSPFPSDQLLPDVSMLVSGAQLERGTSVFSPKSAVGIKLKTPAGSKVPKILLDITNQSGESEFVTPQKRLLNSIDIVDKAVREELQKFRRTPSAKKAEREKRVRTLMSMR